MAYIHAACGALFAYVALRDTNHKNALLLYLKMLRAAGLKISKEDRKRCRETLVNSFGLADNVKHMIVGHVLPATFAPPWVESPEEIEAREWARAQEQELERERQRQYRAALGIPVGPMPRGGGLMNAAAFGVGNLNI